MMTDFVAHLSPNVAVQARTLPHLLKYFLTMVSETALGMPPTYILGPAPCGTLDLAAPPSAIIVGWILLSLPVPATHQ